MFAGSLSVTDSPSRAPLATKKDSTGGGVAAASGQLHRKTPDPAKSVAVKRQRPSRNFCNMFSKIPFCKPFWHTLIYSEYNDISFLLS